MHQLQSRPCETTRLKCDHNLEYNNLLDTKLGIFSWNSPCFLERLMVGLCVIWSPVKMLPIWPVASSDQAKYYVWRNSRALGTLCRVSYNATFVWPCRYLCCPSTIHWRRIALVKCWHVIMINYHVVERHYSHLPARQSNAETISQTMRPTCIHIHICRRISTSI